MVAFRLVFMGTPAFAVPTLQCLIDRGQQVVAVYTQPPRPAGRGHKETPSPVHQLAEKHHIPVFTPSSLKSPEVQAQFRSHQADAAIVAAYGLLLPKPILEAFPMGCINVHPSLLPRWRGAAPIPRTIMAGDRETAMTIMQMDEGLDTGDMLLSERFAISDGSTAGELHDRLASMAGPMVLQALDGLKDGSITAIPQPQEGVTYAHKITKEEAHIDWHRPAPYVRNHILGLSPWPGAWTEYEGEKLKLLEAEAINTPAAAAPGTVLDDRLTIACEQGTLRPTLVQRPGKKPMATEDMLRGHPIATGTVLR